MTFSSARRILLLSLILLASAAPLTATDILPGEWRFLGPDGGPVSELIAAPGNPQVLYAVAQGTLYRSVDGGAAWSRGSDATSHPAVDAANPSLIYAVQPPQLARSANGGAAWQGLRAPGWPVNQLVAHPRFARTVFAVTEKGLFQSTNAGSSWKLLRRGLPAEYRASRLVIDPAAPRRLYLALVDLAAGTPGTPRLFKSLDGGAAWQPIDNGPLEGQPVLALAPHPRSSRILYASTVEDVYKSLDGGRTWTAIGHCGGVQGITQALAVPPDQPNAVYAGGASGLFRSLNAGATWTWFTNSGAISTLLALPRSLFALISAPGHPGGVFKSSDGGSSWTFASRGIHALTVTSIQFGEPGTLWALANNVLFRSTDQGVSWSVAQPRLAVSPDAFAVDSIARSNVFVLFSDGSLWRSGDAGQTWEAGGNAGLQTLDLEIDPQTSSTLYASGYGGIAKSIDGGDTWTSLPLPVGTAFYSDIDIAPSSPSTLYAAGTDKDFNSFFLRSQDGGATWTRLSLFNRNLKPSALAVDPLVATTVYSADDGFILKSTDAGETWSIVSETIEPKSIHPLEASASDLYAAIWGFGVFTLEEGDPRWTKLGGLHLPWIFTALALDPHDPCRVYAGAQATSLLVFTHSGTAECP